MRTFQDFLIEEHVEFFLTESSLVDNIKNYAKQALSMGGHVARLAGRVTEILGGVGGVGAWAATGIGPASPLGGSGELALPALAGMAGMGLAQIPARGLYIIADFLNRLGQQTQDPGVLRTKSLLTKLMDNMPSIGSNQ